MPTVTPNPPPPPPGTAYLAAVKPQLAFLMLAVGLGSPQVPIAIMLFFFSTPQSRRHPMFFLNVLVCALTIANSILETVIDTTNILEPTRILPTHTYLAQISMALLVPWVSDAVLVVRLLAFFPRATTANSTYVRVFAFPVIVKTVRLSVLIAYFVSTKLKVEGLVSILRVGEVTWFRNPYITTEWILQALDNTYLSGFFIYKARVFYKQSQTGTIYRGKSVVQRIKGLLTIALGNFVFPVILNILQVIFILTDPDFTKGTYILITNCYITPLGVLFATIWTSSHHWNSQNNPGSHFSAGFTETVGRFRIRSAARMNTTDTFTLETLPDSANQIPPGKMIWNEESQVGFEHDHQLKEADGVDGVRVHRVARTYDC